MYKSVALILTDSDGGELGANQHTPVVTMPSTNPAAGVGTLSRTSTPICTSNSASPSTGIGKSEFWQYFVRRVLPTGEARAYCKFCTVSYRIPCTTNMGNHMRNEHSLKMVSGDQPSLSVNQDNELEVAKVYTCAYFIRPLSLTKYQL